MDILRRLLKIIAATTGVLATVLSVLLFVHLQWPAAMLWMTKLFVSALSSWLVLAGILSIIVGLATRSAFISVVGIYVALIYSTHIFITTRPPGAATGFEQAFGPEWEKSIKPQQKNLLLPRRIVLHLPEVPNSRLEQNIAFATIPDSDRKVLCDIWQPPANIAPSGLAFIYFHGSAWYFLDKDLGTRPFFTHLAAQGHVIMDVAYRLPPETDMMGMIHDVNRAIHWMKENAATYQVNPNLIVVGGGSSGAHLALMSAYTSADSVFTPGELAGKDISVCGVISLYGPTDLEAMYYHTNQHLTSSTIPGKPKKDAPSEVPAWMKKSMGDDFHRLGFDKDIVNAGAFAPLLGGPPHERPEPYALYSPVTHVNPDCPPTLLIHGKHDVLAPVKTTRILYDRLTEVKVPTVMHLLPQTDHAFDLFLPKLSPAGHNAIYDVERFLALMAENSKEMETSREGRFPTSETIFIQ